MPRLMLSLGLIGCAGCAGTEHLAQHQPTSVVGAPVKIVSAQVGGSASPTPYSPVGQLVDPQSANFELVGHRESSGLPPEALLMPTEQERSPVSESVVPESPVSESVVPESPVPESSVPESVVPEPGIVEFDRAINETGASMDAPGIVASQPGEVFELNLPSALAMVGGQHPAVGFAQWRVQEAYANLARAKVLWLPSIRAGFSFHRHDGNYQASDGTIVDVNRNSFQYGLGAGGTGAGTTALPGVVARFHLADAIFQPRIAKTTAWARGHSANAAVNRQLLTAANAYIELLDAHQDARIFEESRDRTVELSKITGDFAKAGQGLMADADRMQTEAILADNRLVGARERIAIASAELAQALSLDSRRQILPMDPTVVPIDLVTSVTDKASLISTGLSNRPELRESQALVAAACEAYRREKYAPLVPSVLLGFSTGEFGGGLGNNLNNVDGRYDFDALVTWEVRNLGFGEKAERRGAAARVQQAKFEKLRFMDQVAREISEASSKVAFRRQQMTISERAVTSAEDSYNRNLARIRDGQGLPLEVLQSVHALESARRAYLRSVIDHNQAQFQLQWALGWPITAPIDQVDGYTELTSP